MSQYTDLWKVALSRVGEREPCGRKQGKSELVVNSKRGQRSRPRTKPRDRSPDVLLFILTYSTKNGFPPSVAEIQRGCKLSSKSHAHYYLTRLRDQGRVTWEPRSIRTVRVIE